MGQTRLSEQTWRGRSFASPDLSDRLWLASNVCVAAALVTRWGGRTLCSLSLSLSLRLCMCMYLIRGVIVLLQVRVGQGLLHADALVGVKGQHATQQIQSCESAEQITNLLEL